MDPHLVPGLVLKSSYQFMFVPLTLLIFDTSHGLFQQMQYLMNTWPLGGEILQAVVDQFNERVVATELAKGLELGIHICHVPTASLQFSASYKQPTLLVCVVTFVQITSLHSCSTNRE